MSNSATIPQAADYKKAGTGSAITDDSTTYEIFDKATGEVAGSCLKQDLGNKRAQWTLFVQVGDTIFEGRGDRLVRAWEDLTPEADAKTVMNPPKAKATKKAPAKPKAKATKKAPAKPKATATKKAPAKPKTEAPVLKGKAGRKAAKIEGDRPVPGVNKATGIERLRPIPGRKTVPSGPNRPVDYTDPTSGLYETLRRAHAALNAEFFDCTLPPAVFTVRKVSSAKAFYSPQRFTPVDGKHMPGTADEIALNPELFKEREPLETLGTILHEMTHQWQDLFGKPSKRGYHNTEWAEKMATLGLIASDTGVEGGKPTGHSVTHYIEPGGVFDTWGREYVASGAFVLDIHEIAKPKAKTKRNGTRAKYQCPDCGLNAWAKFDVLLACGECMSTMEDITGQ